MIGALREARGIWFMAGSALGFSAMSVLVKIAERTLPTSEVVLARAAITLVLSFVMVVRAGLAPMGNRRGQLLLRGVLGFLALTCYYLAIERLPLAEATVIYHTTPIWTALLAWGVLREEVGRGTGLALALGMTGVLLMFRPGGAALPVGGVAVSLGAAVLSATAYVTVRRLGVTEHPLVIVLYFPMVATPAALVWMIASGDAVMPSAREWLVLAGVGVTTQAGQVLMTYGLTRMPAARAMSVNYLQVVFAVVWGVTLFGEVPRWTTLAGAGLVMIGIAATARAPADSGTPPHRSS